MGGSWHGIRQGSRFELLRPGDLAIDAGEFSRQAAIYGAIELCCAMKPHVISHVLDAGATEVIYLDTDTLPL